MPPGTGRVVSGHLSGQLPAGLSAGPVQVGPPGIDAIGREINRTCACGFITSSMPGHGMGSCASGCCYRTKAGW
jgi:hypothetical protein